MKTGTGTGVYVEPPDDFVPRNNEQLAAVYGGYISRLVSRLNRVRCNNEDLIQHVWEQLVHVDIIGKHEISVMLPKQMTALEAAKFLGVTWNQFKLETWRHRRGVVKKDGTRRIPNSFWPTPLSSHGWSSKKTLYSTEDIIRLDEEAHFRSCPEPRILPRGRCHFKSYLSRAVHNIYANWCRTAFRRHKERPQITMEDGTAWETNLEDPCAISRLELDAELTLAYDGLKKDYDERTAQFVGMVHAGYSIKDAADQVGLNRPARIALVQELELGAA